MIPNLHTPRRDGDDGNAGQNIPAVSWLLCTHVADPQLRLAIRSCLAQTFSDFELIVVANGPDAESVAAAALDWSDGDPRVRIICTPMHQLSFSLSLGLHHARAPLVARMDGDDIALPERLQRQVDFMAAHPEVVVLGTAYEIIDTQGQAQKTVQLPTTDKDIRRALIYSNPFCHPTVMLRRAAVLQAGGYLGGLHAEDYDLWARLSLQPQLGFANLNQVCLQYRVIGVGAARRSRWAYASVASTQLRNFLVGGGAKWVLGALLSIVKLFLRSPPIHHATRSVLTS